MTTTVIDAALAARLVAAQFPVWAHLPIRPVEHGGWDNRTFRLGEDMLVRLPSAEHYAAQVEKEQRWLPRLAPRLPLPIPAPLAMGRPGEGYPWPWSVYRWLPGEPLATAPVVAGDLPRLAADLAAFLAALYRIDPAGGPPPGPHNFWRGAPPAVYDGETRAALKTLAGRIDADLAEEVWEAARAAPWTGEPVWFHGDVAAGNLLVAEGRLAAVIDFGTSGVGDPACDLVIAWTRFDDAARAVFRRAMPLDPAAWARGRGWALWKALIILAGQPDTDPRAKAEAQRTLAAVLADHREEAGRE